MSVPTLRSGGHRFIPVLDGVGKPEYWRESWPGSGLFFSCTRTDLWLVLWEADVLAMAEQGQQDARRNGPAIRIEEYRLPTPDEYLAPRARALEAWARRDDEGP